MKLKLKRRTRRTNLFWLPVLVGFLTILVVVGMTATVLWNVINPATLIVTIGEEQDFQVLTDLMYGYRSWRVVPFYGESTINGWQVVYFGENTSLEHEAEQLYANASYLIGKAYGYDPADERIRQQGKVVNGGTIIPDILKDKFPIGSAVLVLQIGRIS